MLTLLRHSLPPALAVLFVILMAGCGDDEDGWLVSTVGPVVGGPCRDILDCASRSFCAKGGDFPEGTCTLPCNDHDDCPGPSLCMDKQGGICLLACTRDFDCRGGYRCKDEKHHRGGGESLVCIK